MSHFLSKCLTDLKCKLAVFSRKISDAVCKMFHIKTYVSLGKVRVTHQGKTWKFYPIVSQVDYIFGSWHFLSNSQHAAVSQKSILTRVSREAEGQGGSLPWIPVVKGAWIFTVWCILLCKSCASSFASGPSGTSVCP